MADECFEDIGSKVADSGKLNKNKRYLVHAIDTQSGSIGSSRPSGSSSKTTQGGHPHALHCLAGTNFTCAICKKAGIAIADADHAPTAYYYYCNVCNYQSCMGCTPAAQVTEEEVKPLLAFETFAGKIIEQKQPDNVAAEYEQVKQRLQQLSSDRIEFVVAGSAGAARQAAGARPQAPRPLFESPLERYARICAEVKLFQDDMKQLSEDLSRSSPAVVASVNASVGSVPAAELSSLIAKDCDRLASELEGMRAPSASGGSALLQATQPVSSAGAQDRIAASSKSVQSLLSDLERYSTAGTAPEAKQADVEKAPAAGNAITYELFLSPQDRADSKNTVAQLDKRLAALERYTGAGLGAAIGSASGPSTFPYADLRSGMQQLSDRMKLLEKQKITESTLKAWGAELDKLELRARNLNAQQSASAADAALSGRALPDDKLIALYDTVTQWDQCARQLPTLIARLQTLRELHEEGVGAVSRLNHIDASREKLSAMLNDDTELLSTLSAQVGSNAKVMQQNVVSLEKRMSELSARIATLKL